VRSSKYLRLLECQPGAIAGLAGPAMCQRDELRVFERSYTDGVYDAARAVQAHDDLDGDHSYMGAEMEAGGEGRGGVWDTSASVHGAVRGPVDAVDARADGACAMDTQGDSGGGGGDAGSVEACDVPSRQGVSDLVRDIRTAAAVGDGQTVVDSTRRLCEVVHAQGRVVRDAASSARRWVRTIHSLPAHLQREVRRAYLAYTNLSIKIGERDDPDRRRARAGASHVPPVTVDDEERRFADALAAVRAAAERHLGEYFDVFGLGAAGATPSDTTDSAVSDQPPPRKRACVPLGGRVELDQPPPPKRACVVAAAVRAMDTEGRDQAGSAVEAICGTRLRGVREFCVKWAGRSETTWEPFTSLQPYAKQLAAFNERRWRGEQLDHNANAAGLATDDMAAIVAQGESDCAMPAEPNSLPGDTPDEPEPS
jgi:hypothetical protein